MGKVIQFPGGDNPERPAVPIGDEDPDLANLTEEQLETAHQAAEDLGISPDLLHIPLAEINAAQAAIDAMLAHFKGQWVGVSRETSDARQRLIEGYGLKEVFERMAQSTARDWNQRPAFYGALALRILEELQPLEPEEDSEQPPTDES
jgi:hypothetical protein